MGPDRADESGPGVILRGRVLFGADATVAQWVAKAIPYLQPSKDARALGVIEGERLIAGVIYERYNGVHMEVAIAAETGTRWATRQTLRHLFGYPFVQMHCEAITALVPATNLHSLNLATKLGFEMEALVKFAAPDGSPLVVLKMFRDGCKWIDR